MANLVRRLIVFIVLLCCTIRLVHLLQHRATVIVQLTLSRTATSKNICESDLLVSRDSKALLRHI
jgi:hypothetical protein